MSAGSGQIIGGLKLLLLQALVAVVAIPSGTSAPPSPSAASISCPSSSSPRPPTSPPAVFSLFADGTAKIVTCQEPFDITRLLSISDPCFGKTIWQHLLITLTEGILAFLIGAVAGIALGFWLARNALLSAVFDPYIKMRTRCPASSLRRSSCSGWG